MMNLIAKKCVPCEGGTLPLTGATLELYLKEVKGWKVSEGKKIRKEFTFSDFKSALAFVNKVGEIAESEGHHPDVALSWGKAVVELWTHAIGGLSENDFILAAKIDKLAP
ncbi:MAG: 4a-hydroxytetrahydrobiopterin dehydratase [Candidatus Jorgensenbacteria bacterium]|nr:4a-hydroxytetrahydrobiopterin dehydratase [Candidatus Jorgensenbacteria bacterium]